MKMIYVYGDDEYAAIDFENYFKGISVNEIIDRFIINGENHDGDFKMKLYIFDTVDPNFITFVRMYVEDYDMAKHSTFYFESDIV